MTDKVTLEFTRYGKPVNKEADLYVERFGADAVQTLISSSPRNLRGRPGNIRIMVDSSLVGGVKGEAGYELKKLRADLPPVMSEEDFKVFARSATPMLLARAIELALQSENTRDVLAVASALAERGYGKVAQGIDVTIGENVRKSWRDLEGFRPLAIGEFVADAEAVVVGDDEATDNNKADDTEVVVVQ